MATIRDFSQLGQSVWCDYLRRTFITSGELKALIDEGLSGVTSNPTIFEKAVAGSTDYDVELRRLATEEKSVREIYEKLVMDDIADTADLLRPLYEESSFTDGFVSIEVDPNLAFDSKGMVDEAKRYFRQINRPNVMIKIPATDAGFSSVKTLIGEGINVNITLIFSLTQYVSSAEAYLSGLEQLGEKNGNLSHVSSVASFFVSRVDTAVDKALEKKNVGKELRGKIGIANGRIAYEKFRELFSGERWQRLRSRGATIQRVLWASTSTKNPAYPDTLYVDNLIGRNTVNTMPPATLKAAMDHGKVAKSLEEGLKEAKQDMERLNAVGINFNKITEELESEGLSKFEKSIEDLFRKIAQKRERFLAEPYPEPRDLGAYQAEIDAKLNRLSTENIIHRIWKHDYTVWKSQPDEITNRLGWLHIAEVMEEHYYKLEELVDSVRASGYRHVLLLGMGGSSLAAETLARTFGVGEKSLQLSVLDSTLPSVITSYVNGIDLDKTLVIVSSKSGKTTETISLFKYFYNSISDLSGKEKASEHFIAITDTGTELERIADKLNFRAKFLNDSNIGGRYSALSYFGLVPAALIGVDVLRLLDNALTMASACESCVHIKDNPGAWLGTIIGEFARSGRNKLTLVASPSVASLCDWIEQLIAESTGKEGKGILPVVGEKLGKPEVYGKDRLFVYLQEGKDRTYEEALSELEDAGHPVIRLRIQDKYEIGKQFFLWEFATAVAGRILGINPFDQPNVESSKEQARDMVSTYVEKGTFPSEAPALNVEGISIFGNVTSKNPSEALLNFVQSGKHNSSYVALQAYLQRTPESYNELQAIRLFLRDKLKLSTSLGFGPRFLHSTGQLHKGDAGLGIFVQFTCDDPENIQIPDTPGDAKSSVSFGVLTMAEALGDGKALREKGRQVIRFHLGKDVGKSLRSVEKNLSTLQIETAKTKPS